MRVILLKAHSQTNVTEQRKTGANIESLSDIYQIWRLTENTTGIQEGGNVIIIERIFVSGILRYAFKTFYRSMKSIIYWWQIE